MLASIVPQLRKLEDLALHESVAKDDPKLAAKIWEDLRYQSSPVNLYFTNDQVYQGCPFAPVMLAEATSLEDTNIEESDSSSEDSDSSSEDSDI